MSNITNKTSLQVKYRPVDYESVVGQEHITNILRGLRKNGGYKYSNAIVFYGAAGSSKTTNARIYAKSVNCLNPIDGEACNKCENCVAFNSGSYPDFIEVDGASYGKVEDVKRLIDIFNQYTINPNGYRIILIDECHRLSKQAFDIFLKPLEEGQTKTIFLFATTEFDKIPSAIVSRSIICQIRPASSAQIKHQLIKICKLEGIEYDERIIDKMSYIFKGKMRDSIKTLDMYYKTNGNLLSANLENIEEKVLDTIQLSLLQQVTKAYDILDELFVDGSFYITLNGVFSTILLYPNINENYTGINNKKLNEFTTLITKDTIKNVCKLYAEYKPRTISDFKLFIAIMADLGIKASTHTTNELSTREVKRGRNFITNIEQSSNKSLETKVNNNNGVSGVTIDLPSNWIVE